VPLLPMRVQVTSPTSDILLNTDEAPTVGTILGTIVQLKAPGL
jgi:hypothetical protein